MLNIVIAFLVLLLLSSLTIVVINKSTLQLIKGYLTAIVASALWGLGNVITKYTVINSAPNNVGVYADIAIANYLSGALFVFIISLIFRSKEDYKREYSKINFTSYFYYAVGLKGVNTITFIIALSYVSAGIATAVENLHIFWTALIVIIAANVKLSKASILSAIILFFGVLLIINLGAISVNKDFFVGLSFSLAASISFSLFIYFWDNSLGKDICLSIRAYRTAILLIFSCLLIIIIYSFFNILNFGNIILPLSTLSFYHVKIQLLNGVFNIGINYFLMQESLRLMQKLGKGSNFLLGLAISYSVLFTLLFENLILETNISSINWLGITLFTLGFGLLTYKLRDSENK